MSCNIFNINLCYDVAIVKAGNGGLDEMITKVMTRYWDGDIENIYDGLVTAGQINLDTESYILIGDEPGDQGKIPTVKQMGNIPVYTIPILPFGMRKSLDKEETHLQRRFKKISDKLGGKMFSVALR